MKKIVIVIGLLVTSFSAFAQTQLEQEFSQRNLIVEAKKADEIIQKRKDAVSLAAKKIGEQNDVHIIGADTISASFQIASTLVKYSDQTICEVFVTIYDGKATCVTADGKATIILLDAAGNIEKKK